MAERRKKDSEKPVRIGLIGGGRGGAALLQVLRRVPQVHLIGICDIDAGAPALKIARELKIPIYENASQLIQMQGMDWLINVAHTSITQRHILSRELSNVTVIDGHIAELIWRLFQDFHQIIQVGDSGPHTDQTFYELVWKVMQRIVDIAQPVHSELEHIAFHDPLTGLYSRKLFMDFLEREINRVYRHGRPLSLVIMDIDHFKQVNDRFGHDTGDKLLVELAGLFKDSCRSTDLAARYGGEEFVAVLPNTDLESANIWAERMRKRAADTLRRPDNIVVTISLGVAALDPSSQPNKEGKVSPSELFQRADQALYQAKNAGRNRVASYE